MYNLNVFKINLATTHGAYLSINNLIFGFL